MTCLRPLPLLLLLLVPAVYGDEASRAAKAEELVRLSKLEETYSRSIAMVRQRVKSADFRKMLGLGTLTPDGEKLLERLNGSMEAVMDKAIGWDAMKSEYLRIYAEAYTEKELDDLIAFYRSPSGQAMVTKMPTVMAQTNEVVQKKMASLQPEIAAVVRQYVDEAAALVKKAAPAK